MEVLAVSLIWRGGGIEDSDFGFVSRMEIVDGNGFQDGYITRDTFVFFFK